MTLSCVSAGMGASCSILGAELNPTCSPRSSCTILASFSLTPKEKLWRGVCGSPVVTQSHCATLLHRSQPLPSLTCSLQGQGSACCPEVPGDEVSVSLWVSCSWLLGWDCHRNCGKNKNVFNVRESRHYFILPRMYHRRHLTHTKPGCAGRIFP